MTIDLDHFYSQDEITKWQQIIGPDLHYHYGFFMGNEDLETGVRQSVKNFYPHIEKHSKVLDAGCGWGGPAQMLIEEQYCKVKGLTISNNQAQYCQKRGIDVSILDLETHKIPGQFDIVFSLEVLSHIRDKQKVLRKFRQCASRLILTCNCIANHLSAQNRSAFGESMWMCTEKELEDIVKQSGWSIIKKTNSRFQSLRTVALWREKFHHIYKDRTPNGQLKELKQLVDYASQNIALWCVNNPLINIIAE